MQAILTKKKCTVEKENQILGDTREKFIILQIHQFENYEYKEKKVSENREIQIDPLSR